MKYLYIFCYSGVQHNTKLKCCQCESIVLTMARARIWPSTPVNPQMAFTFKILDWAKALLLECQVVLKDICTALSFKCLYNYLFKVYIFISSI